MKPITKKVFAYITHQQKLLVFSQTNEPEAWIQVPGGTVEEGEAPEEAVLREAFEETGLSGLVLESFLGEQERDMADFGIEEIHHRYFYHLRCQEQPPMSWRHEERFPSDNSGTHVFELFWVTLSDGVPQLIADFDLMLPRLIELLGLA